MQSENRFAFKEWASVCDALAQGKQSLLVRKGGIEEGSAGFRVEHREFWLFPTYLHQVEPDKLDPEAAPFLDAALRNRPEADRVEISLYAEVEEVFEIERDDCLPRLHGLQILSPHVLDERFRYRRPGFFLLPVRIHRLDEPIVIPNSPHFDGCRSWVDFPRELPTAGAKPVLDDAAFQAILARIRTAVAPTGFA